MHYPINKLVDGTYYIIFYSYSEFDAFRKQKNIKIIEVFVDTTFNELIYQVFYLDLNYDMKDATYE